MVAIKNFGNIKSDYRLSKADSFSMQPLNHFDKNLLDQVDRSVDVWPEI